MTPPAAVHRTVLVVDVSAFGDRRRTNLHQLTVRRGLYGVLERVFAEIGVSWPDCDHEDRGDGVLVVIPATVGKGVFVELLPERLAAGLRAHNQARPAEEQIRLRLALHAGEIHYDEHGVVGRAVNLAFRLLDSPAFTAAHARSSGLLSIITSAWFFEEVVWHSATAAREAYRRVHVTTKETDTVAWVRLVDGEPAAVDEQPLVARPAAPHQLPPTSRQFVGREAELTWLTELVDAAMSPGRDATVVITAINGTAGIGKTALALALAQRVRGRFPDGELHVNLRGFDEQEPMDASQVLDSFLQTLGVSPEAIPTDLDGKSALYRSLLADRRMLVVLDNARSSDHVRPLLPGSPTCAVVVTSRNRMDSLLVRHGAHRVVLDVLSDEEALALLAQRVGADRLDADPHAAAELVRLCANLPLALSVAAARAASQPMLSLGDLVEELRDERRRLDALDLGEPDLDLRAVFSWSYSVLSPRAANLFRLLGLYPGADIDVSTCDALVGGAGARGALRELTQAHLVGEYLPNRFRLHDLLRAYAAELVANDPERHDARRRVVGHCLSTAIRADRLLLPHRHGRETVTEGYRDGGMELADYGGAMDWFTHEHPTLLAMVGFAAAAGLCDHAWRIAWASTTFLRRTGRWSERVAIHRAALAAVRQAEDPFGEATTCRGLAVSVARQGLGVIIGVDLGPYEEAVELLDRAAAIYRRTADERGAFRNHLAYVRVFDAWGRYDEALAHAEAAWALIRRFDDDDLGRADGLAALAAQLTVLDRFEEARPLAVRALELYTAIGHLEGQADVLLTLGDAERALDLAAAGEFYRRSLELDRILGDRYWEAVATERLAETHPDAADRVAGLRAALKIYQKIRHPAASRVEARLLSATGPPVRTSRR
ncbi:ATP-binding protein [Actinophytocola xanthii]|uniref:NB-ARC domain-containing protein n=1 Tax=Actinophytocola xanthii TaxID=1912961 RepID=A0A1Q8CGL7_9PSEU|nr:NB-ARC domain-containing protein [Actinophytocola xanthii]OLF13517.1 hypothetical protein BU204_26790 [Actinophytocola xanthii]